MESHAQWLARLEAEKETINYRLGFTTLRRDTESDFGGLFRLTFEGVEYTLRERDMSPELAKRVFHDVPRGQVITREGGARASGPATDGMGGLIGESRSFGRVGVACEVADADVAEFVRMARANVVAEKAGFFQVGPYDYLNWDLILGDTEPPVGPDNTLERGKNAARWRVLNGMQA